MQVLIVDESEKKAWRRSRRVLAATLYRRGSRTFTGRLSAEGLKDLVIELKKVASKNTSIVVYKLTSHLEFDVVARVGNTKAWGEEGWYAIRTKAAPQAHDIGLSAVERLLRGLLRIAALMHDLGKANAQFNKMLRGEAGAQRIRHELVSLLIMRTALGDSINPLKALSDNTEELFYSVFEQLRNQSIPKEGEDSAWLLSAAEDVLQKMHSAGLPKLWGAVEYLVLTHHRQIDVDFPSESDPAERAKHFRRMRGAPSLHRQVNSALPLDDGNLELATGDMPWEDEKWIAAVEANAQSVMSLLRNHPELQSCLDQSPEAWVKNIVLIARPTLIQADHLASALKSPSEHPDEVQVVYANTCKNKYGKTVLADSLTTHLLKTRRAVDPYFKAMTGIHKSLPTWRPEKSNLLFSAGPARFAWQEEAARLIRETPAITTRPLLALVVSSTGAGKTLAAPKLLAAAGDNSLRYTCALGLRSLTLQTGAAYRDKLGLDDTQCLTVVGDALYAKLAAPDSSSPQSEFEAQGSESLEELDDLLLDGSRTGDELVRALEFDAAQAKGLARGKVLAMTEAPVLTCTVDHLMGASALAKGTDTRLSLRLATADLVLDEIDNYSPEDLQALGILVHHAASHGRRVVLMSATVNLVVLQALAQAWREGLKVWQLRKQVTPAPVVALISNQVPSTVLANNPDLLETALPQFVQSIQAVLAEAEPKVRAKPIVTGKDVAETFEVILSECLSLAKTHHSVCGQTGARLSTGFVRFNQVANARRFAKYLMDNAKFPDEVAVKVQCYHRRMPLIHLTSIEKSLNSLLNRSDEQAIFRHPLITGWSTNAPLKVVLVCTTSIQETGRDHDYDFAVAEPWSTRSLVQLAGRVRRHRGGTVSEANIGLLTKELNQLVGGSKSLSLELGREPLFLNGKTYHYDLLTHSASTPEREKAWENFSKQFFSQKNARLPGDRRDRWFPDDFYSKGITAGACLSAPLGTDLKLSHIETYAQKKRMTRDAKEGFMALDDATGGYPFVELSWNRHNHVIQFRRSSAAMGQLTLDPKDDFQSLAVVETNMNKGVVQTRERVPSAGLVEWRGGTHIRHPERALVRTDQMTAEDIKAILGRQASDAVALRLCGSFEIHLSQNNGADTQPVDFDPLLGADTSPSDLPKTS